jgi:hypothetical protein
MSKQKARFVKSLFYVLKTKTLKKQSKTQTIITFKSHQITFLNQKQKKHLPKHIIKQSINFSENDILYPMLFIET